jgi:transposase, IS30 family
LKLENKGTPVVSHETIYQFIYTEESQAQKLYLLLTRHKPKRTKWYSRKPRQSHIPESANIKHRPKIIEKRKSIGHWEGDLVVFGSLKGANVTTLVERKSRFVQLVYNRSKYTDEVIGGIAKTMSGLPNKRAKTITFDRGTEFASFRKLGVTPISVTLILLGRKEGTRTTMEGSENTYPRNLITETYLKIYWTISKIK